MTDYKKRLSIPIDSGSNDLELFNSSGSLLTRGYTRIVIGGRGPYIEFEEKHIVGTNIVVPDDQKKRLSNPELYYYVELRSDDAAFTKIYFQLKKVDYADYQIKKFYISPFDLYQKKLDGTMKVLIESLKKRSR